MRLVVIHFTGRAYEASLLGRCGDDKPRVHGDTVTADPGPGLQNLHARVAIRQADEFPDIDLKAVTN